MDYIQLDCYCNDNHIDHLIAILADLGFEGFIETDHGFSAYIPETIYHTLGIEMEIEDLKDLYDLELGIKQVPETNWNKEWESHYEPVKLAGICGVRATFHQPITDVEHEIIIDPKMSFGTGHHETTLLMMEMMHHQDFNDKKILDYGCGTGILAILAAKKKAQSVYAIDIDRWAFENTKENLELNAINGTVVVAEGDVHKIPAEKFDIILANINKNVILESMHELKKRLCDKGILNTSGFYEQDENDIISCAKEQNLHLLNKKSHNSWGCLSFINKAHD